MANTSFSSGFGTGYSITSQWKARKEAKDMIKKQEEEAKAFALDLGARYDRDYKSGTGIDQEEYTNGYLFYMAAGEEQLNKYKDLYKTSMNMTSEELKGNLADYKTMEEMYADVDLKDYAAMEEIIKTWKSPRAVAKGEALMKKWKAAEVDPTKPAKAYSTMALAEAAPENEGLDIQFFAGLNGYVGVPKETSTLYATQEEAMASAIKIEGHHPVPTQMEKGWKITQVKDPTTPAPGTPDSGYRSTSVSLQQQTEEDMLAAETLEEAQKIRDDYLGAKDVKGRGYDPESIKVSDERWTRVATKERTEDLEATVEQLEGLLEEGSFTPGEMKELPIAGKNYTQTKLEWYEDLYGQYMAEYKRLEAVGVNMGKYKKLIPPSELKKLGWGQWGKKAGGDIEGIWQVDKGE